MLEAADDSCKIPSESDMKWNAPRLLTLFVGVMTAVVLVVYLPRLNREQRRARQMRVVSEQAAQKAVADAAAARGQLLDRYLNTRFARNPNAETVAVAAASEDGTMNRAIMDALVSRFKYEDVDLIDSMFRPAFYAEGLFSNTFAGSTEAMDRLALTNYADVLLIAAQQVRYLTNASPQNVVLADMRLGVMLLPLSTMSRERTWTFSADGAGVSAAQARAMAEQRVIRQIAADTRMSLAPPPPDNQVE